MPQTETLLTALLHGLLLEGRVPPGSVIDAGAFDGQTACEYASVVPNTRRVHALDPTPGNVAFMTKRFPNISPMLTRHFCARLRKSVGRRLARGRIHRSRRCGVGSAHQGLCAARLERRQ